jgi:putative membrane protein
MHSAIRRTSIAALCAAAFVAACSKSENNADSARLADSVAAANPAPAGSSTASATPAAPALTDANIAAILDNANMADSAAGSVAATKGTNAEVKTFGRDMMRDHHALRKMGQDLVKKLNVTPEMPAGDNSVAAAKAWQDSLNSMPKGTAWDKAYIDHEVAYHQAVISTAHTAEAAAQNAELKALIAKAIPNLESHLKKAQDIQSKLQSAGAT